MIFSWYHNNDIIINISYKFGQTLKSLILQDFWNDLQFGTEGVANITACGGATTPPHITKYH